MERVLILITSLDRGGAETMIMNYYRHMDRSKVQFDFLVNRPQEGAYEKEIRELGGRIYRMGPMYPLQFHKYKKDFRNFLRQHPEYRIIHSHLEERSYFPLRIAKEEGIPVRIAHAHAEYHGFNAKKIFRDYFRFRLKPYPTHCFTCSVSAARWLYGNKIVDENKFTIIPNAIDSKKYRYSKDVRDKIREELGIGDDTLLLGTVGRLSAEKNQEFLFDVLKELLDAGHNAKLLLVGDGPERTPLEEAAETLGIQDQVIFTGSVPNVPDYLQAMDVFMFPSFNEGLGMALIEAQAGGLPSIASNTVPRAANISGTVEYLPIDNAHTWADAIQKMKAGVRIPVPENLLSSCGFEIQEEANKLQDFYLTALEPGNQNHS
ncbi:glycosyl transferases group 1,glycosyl transferase group 1 [Bifidobacterium animalis subsp. animalis]|uniref:glycosyltransferase family 1 protein n=1 Tax=Bifidobacterium animalis TaxID=28025 RepID=UPI00101E9467|nr:glycosyltransferase family 1 protein [Bifidobacterium animalis]RYN12183.1 glycosyl transferases group 1,glycosyl transferase group 1 [Bifidobacterium animalis subsp. animalis]